MDKKYIVDPPFSRRPVTINTLCVVGVCTCILIKIAVEKTFKALGFTDIDVAPSVEDNPRGSRSVDPDICFLEGLRLEEIQSRMPNTLLVEIKDLGNHESVMEETIKVLSEAGWLKEVD